MFMLQISRLETFDNISRGISPKGDGGGWGSEGWCRGRAVAVEIVSKIDLAEAPSFIVFNVGGCSC
jgi:hypothetical protein